MSGIPVLHVEADCIARGWEESLIELNRNGCSIRTEYDRKDERGEWHVTDRPPPGRTSFEVKRYGLDTNILPVSRLLPGRESTD